jgi:phosphoribosylglycinamide formyltransferase 1
MFKQLQEKWRVNGFQLTLILITFALGGSLTGYIGKKLLSLLGIDERWLWIVIYIIVIVLLWPIAVILISVFTGQFRFFKNYIRKIGVRMHIVPGIESRKSRVESNKFQEEKRGLDNQSKPKTNNHGRSTKIAIFASGAGSNAQKIIDYFRGNAHIKVGLIACNNPQAGVLKIAASEKIPAILIEKEKFFRGNAYLDELKTNNIDFIVLAGFLWKLPSSLIKEFSGRIVNIHPALLPKYGGKGMYGNNVHAAVIAAGEKESGITIHYVDEHYDNGDIILQVKCPVLPNDNPDLLAQRIHQLEHEHFPKTIEKLVNELKKDPVSGDSD